VVPPIIKLGSTRGLVNSAMPLPLCSRERESLPFIKEAGWVSEQVWMFPEIIALNRVSNFEHFSRYTDYAVFVTSVTQIKVSLKLLFKYYYLGMCSVISTVARISHIFEGRIS
jgi:hypothetical protein